MESNKDLFFEYLFLRLNPLKTLCIFIIEKTSNSLLFFGEPFTIFVKEKIVGWR